MRNFRFQLYLGAASYASYPVDSSAGHQPLDEVLAHIEWYSPSERLCVVGGLPPGPHGKGDVAELSRFHLSFVRSMLKKVIASGRICYL